METAHTKRNNNVVIGEPFRWWAYIISAEQRLFSVVLALDDLRSVETRMRYWLRTKIKCKISKTWFNAVKSRKRPELNFIANISSVGQFDSSTMVLDVQVNVLPVKPVKIMVQMHQPEQALDRRCRVPLKSTMVSNIFYCQKTNQLIFHCSIHALEIQGKIPLELIEVSQATY